MDRKRTGKSVFIASITLSLLLLSACSTANELAARETPTETLVPSLTATSAPTATPSPTATPTTTLTPTPSYPEEFIDQIDHQETLPDGRIAAVDSTGKRILQINPETEEWISYQRQIGIIKDSYLGKTSFPVPSLPEEMKAPLPEEEIHRIHDKEGSLIPFGYLPQYREEFYEERKGGYWAYKEFFSGIVRGCLESDDDYEYFLVIEIPNQNGDSQYLIQSMVKDSPWGYSWLRKFYEGNIDDYEGWLTDTMITDGLVKPDAVGHQIIIGFWDADGKEIPRDDPDQEIKFGEAQDEFFKFIKKNEIYNDENGYTGKVVYFYIPAELIEEEGQ